MTSISSTRKEDSDLWAQVIEGSAAAFEIVVAKYQNAVSAVSYSRVGDFNISEDISQETFLVAWQSRDSLDEPEQLRAWLCGIARNLSNNYLRQSNRHSAPKQLVDVPDSSGTVNEAESKVVAQEEQALVWSTLESIDETYREPLVLYYREGATVAEIGSTLGISADAAKQRLSRGRTMLRDSVALIVSQTLEHTRLGHKFTSGVMAAIGSAAWLSKPAAAAGSTVAAAKASSSLAAASAAGLGGAFIGSAAGLGGAWLGTWIPTQLAATREESELMRKSGQRVLWLSAAYTVAILILTLLLSLRGGLRVYFVLLFATILAFIVSLLAHAFGVNRKVHALRMELGEMGEPNDTQLKRWVGAERSQGRWLGKKYQSRARFLGRPWIDVQFSDLEFNSTRTKPEYLTARGWIAFGDRADGWLMAFGGIARGLIAAGGIAYGGICFGGVSLGIVALGGLGLGLLAIGGLAIGGLALGGGAIGYDAVGGGALAWHCAAGGGAIAHHAAIGGGALARDYAVGGAAAARQANMPQAKAYLDQQWVTNGLKWMERWAWLSYLAFPLGLLPAIGMRLFYRKENLESTPP
ncbi:MAG: sigma-70 family RNA polymerase sigma factor [Planctomycetales bacterium]|nr:sigma-70 family RNA polymerase sigma factor [Planctomycetales bacterium]